MKVSTSKSKNAESVYILKSYRIKGKSTTKTYKKLGTMEELLPQHSNDRDEVMKWAKEQAEMYTRLENEGRLDIQLSLSQTRQIPKDEIRSVNGGHLFIDSIFYDLKLDRLCRDIASRHQFGYDLAGILKMLLSARIIYPSSKKSSYEHAQSYIEKPDFEQHQIYRALSILAKESDLIQEKVYRRTCSLLGDRQNRDILYYDVTNYYFEIEQEKDDLKYAKSKEHRPNPIIQMGLFMDGDGIPLAFNINPGNTNEQVTLKPTEQRIIDDLGMSRIIVCTDGGLASTANRKFNNRDGRSYIVTQSLKKVKKFILEWALDPSGWSFGDGKDGKKYRIDGIDDMKDESTRKIFYEGTFYKERWIKENGLEQRIIVTYSLKYRDYQRKVRERQVERAMKLAKQGKTKAHSNPNDVSKYLKVTNTTSNGEVADEIYVEVDQDAIDKEARYDGFYAVCTTLEDDAAEIMKINKRRWEIEESFRIMKNEFKARPVYLSRQERIEGHFLTCYLALVIFRILEKELDEKYTVDEIIETLRNMNFQHYEGFGYVPSYKRTDLTDSLNEKFGIQTDREIIGEKNMKKILRKVKS